MVYQVVYDIANFNNVPLKLFTGFRFAQDEYEERNSQIGSKLTYSMHQRESQSG